MPPTERSDGPAARTARYAFIALAASTALAALLACANYLAGAILFLSLGEHPAGASFTTIERAWQAASDESSIERIRGSIAFALIVCIWLPLGLVMATCRRHRGASPRH